MAHYATRRFWFLYYGLPPEVRALADRCFSILEQDPRHPSLHLKKVGRLWSVRVGRDYRALSIEVDDGFRWIWIGSHSEYDRLIRR